MAGKKANPRNTMKNAITSVKKRQDEARDKSLGAMKKLASGEASRHDLKQTVRELETRLQNESAVNALETELTEALTEAKELLAKRYAAGDGKSAADKLDEQDKTLIRELLENVEATSSSGSPSFDSVYKQLQAPGRRVPDMAREEWEELYDDVVRERASAKRGRPRTKNDADKKPTDAELSEAGNLLEKLDGEFVRYAGDRLETLLDEAATWEEAREAAEALGRLQPGEFEARPKHMKHTKRDAEEDMQPERQYAGILQDLRELSNDEEWLEDFFAEDEDPEEVVWRKKTLVEDAARKAVGQAAKTLKGLVDGASGKEPGEALDETAKKGIGEAVKKLKEFQTTLPSANRVLLLAGGNPNIGLPRYKEITRKHDETIGDDLRDAESVIDALKQEIEEKEGEIKNKEAELRMMEAERRRLRSTTRKPLATTWMRPGQTSLVILGGDDRELRALEARIAELRALRDETRRVLEKLAGCLRAYREAHDA